MRVPALLLVLSLGASSAHATHRNFSFRRATPLTTIFETFAKLGDFNVIVSPAIRGNMTLELNQVTPRDAMYMVAQVQQLTVHRLRNEGQETYMIAQSDVIQMAFGRETRLIRLRHQPLSAIFDPLKEHFAREPVGLQKLPSLNALILSGVPKDMDRAESIIRYADVPSPLLQVDIRVERDGKPVWKTSLKGRSGREIKAVVGPEDDGRSTPSYLTLALSPRVGPDRRVAVDAAITLAPRRDSLPDSEIFNQVVTAAEVVPDEYIDLANIEAPNGQALKFRVMFSLLDPEPAPDLDAVPLSAIDIEPGDGYGASQRVESPSDTLGNALPSSVDVIDLDADVPPPSPEGDLGSGFGEDLGGHPPPPLELPATYEPPSSVEPASDDLGDLGDLGDI